MTNTLYSAAQVRELDRIAIEEHGIAGLTLMRRAAEACARQIEIHWPQISKITVFCGGGNNAGDGYIIAGILSERGCQVQVIVVGDKASLGDDAAAALQYCEQSEAVLESGSAQPQGDMYVDALLGTGLSGEVQSKYVSAIQQINGGDKPVLSVDIPSGLCADTGSILGISVQANVTVTFIGRKRGLYTNDGPDCSGEIVFDSLSVPENIADKLDKHIDKSVVVMRPQALPARRKNSHKTRNGHLLVVGGDSGMGGAVLMSGIAAFRCGAGIVSIATRQENVAPFLARCPELMTRKVDSSGDLKRMMAKATAMVIGPGLGTLSWGKELLVAALDSSIPLVIDADGLTLLAEMAVTNKGWILTPHPGEALRLLEGRTKHTDGESLSEIINCMQAGIQSDRFTSIELLQRNYDGVILLKGVGTLVSDGIDTSLCSYGNPGMASAGMGDVLSGVIGGLIAQGLNGYHAATTGACLHARAGDIAAEVDGERGLLATDLIPLIRRLVNDKDQVW
ncbi:MAG: NAD(P)H-hydrate dehydratase [Pseudomonadales bacterium]|jgi:NAD(P)H-hydrate epimerase